MFNVTCKTTSVKALCVPGDTALRWEYNNAFLAFCVQQRRRALWKIMVLTRCLQHAHFLYAPNTSSRFLGFCPSFPKICLMYFDETCAQKNTLHIFFSRLSLVFRKTSPAAVPDVFFTFHHLLQCVFFFFFFGIVRIFWVLMLCHNAHLGSSLSAAVRSFGLAWRLLAQENLPTGNKKLTLIRPTLVTWQHAGYI